MRTLTSKTSQDKEELKRRVSYVGQRLNDRQPEIARAMAELLSTIDYLDGDPRLIALLEASTEGNIETIFHVLINDIAIANLKPATAAVEYAERLAQRGVPANSLVRAYHMGQDDLMASCFEEVHLLDCDAEMKLQVLHHISSVIYEFVDWICLYLLGIYEAEQQRWNTTSGHVHTAMLHSILARKQTSFASFETETGYRLDQYHVALIIWSESSNPETDLLREIEHAARRLASSVKAFSAPVFSAVDRSTAWVWIPRGSSRETLDHEDVTAALAKVPGARASIGIVGHGVTGFRRSHEQAEAARLVAMAGGTDMARVVAYSDRSLAVVSMLTHDMEGLRAWVQESLGQLAVDSESNARLRETTLTFFSMDSHHSAASDAMTIHRNTLKYRLERAEATRGRPLTSGRLDLELALQVCRYLGSSVLLPPTR
ncbi:PucR family transcriptional regulator [Rhodococcoides fascians]|uniref:PucR family transcriptional regulator n=1 Tax=Rhodococcoides fascians TaxID=1828 RepID=UPI00050CBE70|nr:helix-turn-helix domain-containing protein [Rhodococcus fascians]